MAFTPEQKYELAGMLSDAGIHIIDMGFPSAAPSERRALELILEGKRKGRLRPDLEIIVMCRSNARDIDVTLDTLEKMGARPDDCTFFIFTSGSDLHLKYKIGKTLLQLEGRQAGGVAGPARVLLPRGQHPDGLRRHPPRARAAACARSSSAAKTARARTSDYLIELARACYEAGGTRYSFPDTVGFFAPEGVDYYIPKLVAAFPDRPLVVHFHNDFGLGAYNTVRALHHGATVPTCTVNGLGERAGNAPLHTTVMILKELYGDHRARLPLRHALGAAPEGGGVQRASRWAPREPVIGHNVFSHETGIHTAGITIHPAIYQVIEPEAVGGRLRFLFGKHSGAMAIEAVLARHREELGGRGRRGHAAARAAPAAPGQGSAREEGARLAAPRRHPQLLQPPRAPGPDGGGPGRLRAGPRPERGSGCLRRRARPIPPPPDALPNRRRRSAVGPCWTSGCAGEPARRRWGSPSCSRSSR